MSTVVTLDKAGRVVIPKTVRDELHLSAGDSLELESGGEGVTLRPVRSASTMRKKQGVWVFHGRHTISAATTDRLTRELRDSHTRDSRQ